MTAEQLALNFGTPTPALPQLWTPDDIFNVGTEAVVRQFAEDRRVERKPRGIHAPALADWVCMWANTHPHGGLIFIGVEDDGKVTGCRKLSQEQINKLELVKTYCNDAKYEFTNVAVKNDSDGENDFVMILRVWFREDKLVTMNDGTAWVRRGDQKHRLTEEEKRDFRIARGEVAYELEQVNLAWPDDFDTSLADVLANSFRTKRGLTQPQTREQILSMLHLGKISGGKFLPNIACAIVLAKDPRAVMSGARIRVSRYDGPEESFGKEMNQVSDAFIDGPLPYQIQQVEKIITPQIRNFTRLGKDSRFYTQPEYPLDVWLEAIVNACVHRSYSLKQMNIFVKMFANKMVIESPGGFLPPTTPATVYESHNPRNPYLMEALFYLDFVHCAYEGTRRMRQTMRANNLPDPEFSQKEIGTHQVHVTLKNNVEARKTFLDANVADLIGRKMYEALTEEEKLLINFGSEEGKISISDAVRLTGKARVEAKEILESLVERKILELRAKTGKLNESSKRYVLRRPNGK